MRSRFLIAGALIPFVGGLLMLTAFPAFADGRAVLEFRQTCNEQTGGSGFAGTIPGSNTCSPYPAKDPLTQQTPILRPGDTLDLQIVLRNPDAEGIARMQQWIAYDPTVLEGLAIEVNPQFPTVAANANTFVAGEGYIKLAASALPSALPKETSIVIARITMRVLPTENSSTALTFYDASDSVSAHTAVIAGEGTNAKTILSRPLGSLLIRFKEVADPPPAPALSSSSSSIAPAPQAASSSVSSISSISSTPVSTLAPSSSASSSTVSSFFGGSAASALSSSSLESLEPQSSASSIPLSFDGTNNASYHLASNSTPFSSLQVSDLSITTEGTSVFLAWDELHSSELVGYNLYYGTVSGQYIQRRSIDLANTTSAIVRDLPRDSTYYFAIRGVSRTGKETDYSGEVAVTVGNPATSTRPIIASTKSSSSSRQSVSTAPSVRPVIEPSIVYVEAPIVRQQILASSVGKKLDSSGLPSSLLLFALLSTLIGMAIALRRQFIAVSSPDL